MLFVCNFPLSSVAETQKSLTLFAGKGLSHNKLSAFSNYREMPAYKKNDFLMGIEYSCLFEPKHPISWNFSFFTSNMALFGLGIESDLFKLIGKFGIGLKNTDPDPITGSIDYPDLSNYGIIYGLGVEVKLSSNLGISTNYMTNNSWFSGLTFHW